MTEPTPEAARAEALGDKRAVLAMQSSGRDKPRLALLLTLGSLASVPLTFVIGLPALVMGLGACFIGGVLGVMGLFGPRRKWSVLESLVAIAVASLPWILVIILPWGAGSPGRPLRVGRSRALPRVLRRKRARALPDAGAEAPDPSRVPGALRRVLAALWLADARAEHASVPAFERLAEDLTAAGAPDHLVAWARRAALEEVGHAAVCFAIASAYAGRELSASSDPFAPAWAPGAESQSLRIRRLALESLTDGCLEEGHAAECARLAAEHARDPYLRQELERIAREEAGHADLAVAVVVWALAEDPSLFPLLVQALERSRRELRRPWLASDALLPYGRIGRARSARLAKKTHEDVARRLRRLEPAAERARE
jgi:hypothetical protein